MSIDIFKDLPTLQTERLVLRKFNHEDVSDVYDYAKDPKVAEYVLWYPHSSHYESLEFINNIISSYLKGEPSSWCIQYKKTGKVIGSIGFVSVDLNHSRGEIGFALSREFWKKGLMSEAVSIVIKFGFEYLKLNRIQAHTHINNKGSGRVLLKCGMQFEGTLRQFVKVKGEFWDVNYYSIIKKEWKYKLL
jgi:ribosomal-protein-alanine N-acetyltransferase